ATRRPSAGPVPQRSRSPSDAPATDQPRSAAGGTPGGWRRYGSRPPHDLIGVPRRLPWMWTCADQRRSASSSLGPFTSRGMDGGSAADTPTSRALAGAFLVTPLLSQAANGHRAGSTHPKRANPGRRQELRESPRPVSYGDATRDHPGRRHPSLHTRRNYVTNTPGELRDRSHAGVGVGGLGPGADSDGVSS